MFLGKIVGKWESGLCTQFCVPQEICGQWESRSCTWFLHEFGFEALFMFVSYFHHSVILRSINCYHCGWMQKSAAEVEDLFFFVINLQVSCKSHRF
jgi:hypothetical protein